MSAKSRVLELLIQKKGAYISGQEMADALQVSRNTVWKAVKGLQEQGYAICAVPNRGYCLEEKNSRLSKEEIQSHLSTALWRLEVCDSLPSTNTALKHKAQLGEPEGLVLIAQEQTNGRGRRDRSFYSPRDCGIYMSLLLRPSLEFSQAACLTACAAAAVAQALDEFIDGETQIKWVNDILYHEKKSAGILTEAAVDMEDGKLEYAVLGIGVNVYPPANDYPEELRSVVGSLFSQRTCREDVRNQMIARILDRFSIYYQTLPQKEYYDIYRQKSIVLGRPVQILQGANTWQGLALDLDENFRLLVQDADGRRQALSSGEVRINY